MKVASVILGLLAVLGVAAGAYMARQAPLAAASYEPFDPSTGVDERLRALEAAITVEQDARRLLEDELQTLYAEIERLEITAGGMAGPDARSAQTPNVATAFERRALRLNGDPPDRVQILVDGGFSPDRAEWLARRESALQMEAMQARFDARRSGEPFDPFDQAMNPGAALREELGDLEYEQYLEASGRPTSVGVGAVLESSPGQRAGMLPGDEIVSYDGRRVFSSYELNQQTMQGEPGESVIIGLKRDGQLMQVVVPRGPIGVTTRSGFGRRRGG